MSTGLSALVPNQAAVDRGTILSVSATVVRRTSVQQDDDGEVAAPEVKLDEADPEAPLQEATDLDSMDFLNLVTALHEETGIDVPERDYPLLSTVSGFVAYVAEATVP